MGFSELAFRGLMRKVSSLHFEILQKGPSFLEAQKSGTEPKAKEKKAVCGVSKY